MGEGGADPLRPAGPDREAIWKPPSRTWRPSSRHRALLKEEIDEEDIARIVAKWTGIPVSRMMEGEIQKLVQMAERLKERVIGQDEAVRLVSNAILRNRAGLSDPNRPIGSFIFLGSDGRRQDRAGAGRWPSSCSTTRRP